MKQSLLKILITLILISTSILAQPITWDKYVEINPTLMNSQLSDNVKQSILHLVNSTFVEDTTYFQNWRNEAWQYVSKWQYPEYNDEGRATKYVSYSYIDSSFELASKEEYEYNNGTLITTSSRYENEQWVLTTRITYTNYFGEWYSYTVPYDMTIEYWENDQWIERTKLTVTYNNSVPESALSESLVDSTNSFEPNYKNLYQFDSQNQMTQSIHQNYTDGEFVNNTKTDVTYDANGFRDFTISSLWDVDNGEWQFSQQVDDDYDADGNIQISTGYRFENDDWQLFVITDHSYENGLYMGYLQSYNRSNGLEETNKLITSHDADGNIIEHLNRTKFNGEWTNNTRLIHTYKSITTTDEENQIPEKFVLGQNYPNPFNPTTKIRYSIPGSSNSSRNNNANIILKVYDILGNEVATLVNEQKAPGAYEVNFNASNLSTGVYVYKLQTGNKIQSKKMILLK